MLLCPSRARQVHPSLHLGSASSELQRHLELPGVSHGRGPCGTTAGAARANVEQRVARQGSSARRPRSQDSAQQGLETEASARECRPRLRVYRSQERSSLEADHESRSRLTVFSSRRRAALQRGCEIFAPSCPSHDPCRDPYHGLCHATCHLFSFGLCPCLGPGHDSVLCPDLCLDPCLFCASATLNAPPFFFDLCPCLYPCHGSDHGPCPFSWLENQTCHLCAADLCPSLCLCSCVQILTCLFLVDPSPFFSGHHSQMRKNRATTFYLFCFCCFFYPSAPRWRTRLKANVKNHPLSGPSSSSFSCPSLSHSPSLMNLPNPPKSHVSRKNQACLSSRSCLPFCQLPLFLFGFPPACLHNQEVGGHLAA
mmetsp:Transcript_62045/g.110341  ORF Transcript_62045/g.110341 Transcript_62045/m.110341 type:complete len:368 (-) Transcript_62045:510-1613(-)